MKTRKNSEGTRDFIQMSPMLVVCYLGIYGFILLADVRTVGLSHEDMLSKQKAMTILRLADYENSKNYTKFSKHRKEFDEFNQF